MNRNWCCSPRRGCSKRARAHRPLGAVEHARRAVLLDAVALDVPQVPGGRLGAVASQLVHVRLDDDAPSVVSRTEPGRRRQLHLPPGRPGARDRGARASPREATPRRHDRARDRSCPSEVESRSGDRRRVCPSCETFHPPSVGVTDRRGGQKPRFRRAHKEPRIDCSINNIKRIRGPPLSCPPLRSGIPHFLVTTFATPARHRWTSFH